MAKLQKIGPLEISQDLDFQRRSWRVQRFGWVLMLMVSLAALLGLFGRGILSSAHLGADASPIRAEYERFLRANAPGTLTIFIGSAAIRPDSTAELWLDRTWLAGMKVRAITPEPDGTRMDANRVMYTFSLDPAAAPARVTFDLETRSSGRINGRVGLVNGPSYNFSQFSYP
jgi:hypothetical protein